MTALNQIALPLSPAIAAPATLDWATAADGAIGLGSSWLNSDVGPATTDTAVFATGSGTPYSVSGDAALGGIEVLGDTVTVTGSIEATGMADGNLPSGAPTDLQDDGSMTIAAGAALTGSNTAIVGASGAGALTIAGQVTEGIVVVGDGNAGSIDVTGAGASLTATTSMTIGGLSSGSVTVENGASLDVPNSFSLLVTTGGTLALDASATINPTAINLDGGLLRAVGGAANGNVTVTNILNIASGQTGHVGSDGGVLTLNGLILGGGALEIDGGEVRLGLETGLLGAVAVQVNGGTLDSNGILGGGAGDVTTMADSANTIRLSGKAMSVASNGTDLLQLYGTVANVVATGTVTVDSYATQLNLEADGAAATVDMNYAGTASLAGAASATIMGNAGGTVDATGLLGSLTYLATAALNVTVLAGAGATSIASGTGASDIVLGAGSANVQLFGNNSVHTGSGAATVTAMGSDTTAVAVSGGVGNLTFIGGAGSATVGGGSGSTTLYGGTGGGVLFAGAGGGSFLQAGGGSTILVGIADQDTLQGAAGGANILFAGAGAETLIAGGSDGNGGGSNIIVGGTGPDLIEVGGNTTVFGGVNGGDTITGTAARVVIVSSGNDVIQSSADYQAVFGSDTGGDVITGGGGTNILIAGGGAETLQAGGASTMIFGTTGADVFAAGDGSATIVAGTGQATVDGGAASARTTVAGTAGDMTVNGGAGQMVVLTGAGSTEFNLQTGGLTVYEFGAGPAAYDVIAGQAGGDLFITGFRAGTDTLNLSGYAPSQLSQTQGAGSDVLHLTDGTTITLFGVTTATPVFG